MALTTIRSAHQRRSGAFVGRWAGAVLSLGLALAGLAESHPGAALHGDLPAAVWVFPEARHGSEAPHAEAAGAPHRFECRACLHRLQTSGAALRAVAAARRAPTAGELDAAHLAAAPPAAPRALVPRPTPLLVAQP